MLVLVIGHLEPNFDSVVRALRRKAFVPIIATSLEQGRRLLDLPEIACSVVLGTSELVDSLIHRVVAADLPIVAVRSSTSQEPQFPADVPAIYLPPAASPDEIALTCRAAVPRIRLDEPQVLVCGPLTLDLEHKTVSMHGIVVDVPPKGFLILREIALAGGGPVSSQDLVRRAWPDDEAITVDDVHRHVYRLRLLLGDQERGEPVIVNRRGFGYSLGVPVRAVTAGHVSAVGSAGITGATGAGWRFPTV